MFPAPRRGAIIREGYLFLKKRYPSLTPSQRKFALQACSSKSCGAYRLLLAARGKAALSATIRFASAPTIRCRSAHLVEVQTNLLLPTMHTVSIMRTAMPLRQAIPGLIESEVERSYVRVMNRRQSDSEDRSKSNRLDIKQGRHLIRQALQFFELLACNGGGKGQGPLRSLGGPRGIFSHVREYPPYPQPHTVWGKAAASSGCSPSAPCAEKERTSLSRSPLFLLIFCCAEAIIPLPASPSRQRQPSPVRRRNTARSARSASRTSRGTGSWSAGQWRSSSALPRGTRPR